MSELAMTSIATDPGRRRFLVAATTVVGGIGVAALAVPFISAMNPSARARSAGAPVNVDVSKLEPGQQITVDWRGKPVWILRRTPKMLDDLQSDALRERLRDPDSTVASQQPVYAGLDKIRCIESPHLFLDDFVPQQQLIPVLQQHGPGIRVHPIMAVAYHAGICGKQPVDAFDGHLQEKSGRCCRPYVEGVRALLVKHAPGFSGKQDFRDLITGVVGRMARCQDCRDVA